MAKSAEERIKDALGVCSTWVRDESGDMRKDCIRCPYQDPTDPAGLCCGERLMKDARKRIEDLEKYACEMKRIALKCGKEG